MDEGLLQKMLLILQVQEINLFILITSYTSYIFDSQKLASSLLELERKLWERKIY